MRNNKDLSVVRWDTLMCDNDFINHDVISKQCYKKLCINQATCHVLVDLLRAGKKEEAKPIIEWINKK